jgi:hypothetical protein
MFFDYSLFKVNFCYLFSDPRQITTYLEQNEKSSESEETNNLTRKSRRHTFVKSYLSFNLEEKIRL